jgi:hypothetical protein
MQAVEFAYLKNNGVVRQKIQSPFKFNEIIAMVEK